VCFGGCARLALALAVVSAPRLLTALRAGARPRIAHASKDNAALAAALRSEPAMLAAPWRRRPVLWHHGQNRPQPCLLV